VSSCHQKMPWPPTFLIGEVTVRPEAPETWSFSTLWAFEECPLRWALSRTVVSCFGGPIPQKPNRCSAEGILLHALIERLARHTMQGGVEVFRPRRTLLELLAGWARDNARNPRIDSKVLAGQVRVEEILRSFGEARSHAKMVEGHPARASSSGRCGGVFEGCESWLRDPGSKLCGRADLISCGEIVDFKSGEERDYHIEQIRFYGALYLAQSGRPPTGLRLIYTGANKVRDVAVPTLNELKLLLEEMRGRAAVADRQVAGGGLPAKPEPRKCAYSMRADFAMCTGGRCATGGKIWAAVKAPSLIMRQVPPQKPSRPRSGFTSGTSSWVRHRCCICRRT